MQLLTVAVDRPEDAAPDTLRELLERATQLTEVSCDQLRRSRWGRRAAVGDKVDDRGVDLVADTTDDRALDLRQRARQRLVVEA